MSALLTREARELIDLPEPAVLATVNDDGTPHTCVMWVARDGDRRLMSTKPARRRYRDLQRRPRASVLVDSRRQPRRYVEVRGRAQLGGEGARELMLRLAGAYLGGEHTSWPDEDERALIRIIPDRALMHG